ncbi:MAG: type II toxin-antitoxin system PemK/MazF family toxin [Candidatus Diapherotrites archaeon]
MERFVKGDVVVIPFPFSDLSQSKRRPAMVLASLQGNDIILCQITSGQAADRYSIPLTESEFTSGTLKQESNIRPNKIFTADSSIVEYRAGVLKEKKTKEITEKVCAILRG